LPQQLSDAEVAAAVKAAIGETGAASIKTWARCWLRSGKCGTHGSEGQRGGKAALSGWEPAAFRRFAPPS
jgi:hypothetical protein